MFCLVMAPHPRNLLHGSLVSPSLAAAVINGKYVNAVPLYRLEKEFERYGLTIYDCRSKGRGYKASMKQISGMGCLYHVFIQFTGINADMMFLYHDTGRNELITSGNGIRKLFPSVFTKLSRQFFLFQILINTFHGSRRDYRIL